MDQIREIVHQHSLFFDNLVNLVPAKFYLPSEAPEDIWSSGKNKAARAKRKTQTKQNLKLAKRKRLDPEEFLSTSQLLQQQSNAEEGTLEVPPGRKDGLDRAVTREQLVAKLHKRLEMLRAKRQADEATDVAKRARNWQTEVKEEGKKRKAAVGALNKQASIVRPAKRPKPAAENSSPASAKATVLQKEHQGPNKGQVQDDPALLKRSLKKEKHQRQKSVEKGEGRTGNERKQQKRQGHLPSRVDKKDRSISKREKDLLRPGFEGRKQGFINT
eukprot:TRINITY_DN13969_c0_g1_i4.p1 TRINITY_DN13969_c0_g1~~TRINITY_DN13969_c0_g1_i4.p1  ORF type:complete len:273 (-),score=59.57 TRINITY_DN13969_c0_g1_i4:265-1083(-)